MTNPIRHVLNSFGHFIVDAVEQATHIVKAPQGILIEKDPEALARAIESRESLVIKSNGTWYKNRWIVALFRKIIRKNESILTARQLAAYLTKPTMITIKNEHGEEFEGYTRNTTLTPEQIKAIVEAVRKALGPKIMLDAACLAEAKKDYRILKTHGELSQPELLEFAKQAFDKSNFPAWNALANLQRAQISSFYLGESQESIEKAIAEPQDTA